MWDKGPSDRELEAYRTLVDHGPMTSEQLTAWRDDSPEEIAAILAGLADAELITHTSDGMLAAAPPGLALGAILQRTLEDTERLRTETKRLQERYRQRGGSDDLVRTIDVVEGRTAVVQFSEQLMSGAQKSLVALGDETDLRMVPPGGWGSIDTAVTRISDHRLIFARSALGTPGEFADSVRGLDPMTQLRILPEIPIRLMMVDYSSVVIPLVSPDEFEGRIMILRDSPLVTVIAALFEYMWRAASPVTVEGAEAEIGDILGSADAAILGLMLTGATDRAISHEVGKSLRTVQRRVQAMMQQTGATSRIQLGYEAGRRGWLSGPDHRVVTNVNSPAVGGSSPSEKRG